jgi:hypothetical protein
MFSAYCGNKKHRRPHLTVRTAIIEWYLQGELNMIKGSCECRRIRYQVDGELLYYGHCHCSKCRKLHGAAFASWGGVLRTAFTCLSGESEIRKYAFSDQSDSLFCNHCGSRILVDSNTEPEMLYIAMGTVDGEVTCPEGVHEWVGSKAPWYEISDNLPEYDEAEDK